MQLFLHFQSNELKTLFDNQFKDLFLVTFGINIVLSKKSVWLNN